MNRIAAQCMLFILFLLCSCKGRQHCPAANDPKVTKLPKEGNLFTAPSVKKQTAKGSGDAFASKSKSKSKGKERDAFSSNNKKESNLGDKANGKEPKERKKLRDKQSKTRRPGKTPADEKLAKAQDNPMGTSAKKKKRNERYRKRKSRNPDLDLFPPGVIKK